MSIRMYAFDGHVEGPYLQTAPFPVNNGPAPNRPPVVTIHEVIGNAGILRIIYEVQDPDGDTCDVELQYSMSPWRPAPDEAIEGDYRNLRGGTYEVKFNTGAVLDGNATMLLKLLGTDSWGATSEVQTPPRMINNTNRPPVVQSIGLYSMGAPSPRGDIEVRVMMSDPDGDPCTAEIEFSLQDGAADTYSRLIQTAKRLIQIAKRFIWIAMGSIHTG